MQLILLNLVLAIISSFVASYIVLTRKYVRARLMAFIVMGASIWSYGYAMEMYFLNAEAKLVWAYLQFLGMAMTNVVPLFIAHFFDRDDLLTKRNVALVMLVPSIFLLLVGTNPFHNAVLTNVSVNHLEPHYPLIKSYGWAAYGFMAYTYGFIVLSLLYAAMNAKNYSEVNWKKIWVILGLMAIPIISSSYFMLFAKGIVLDYTAPIFNTIGICLALFTPSDMREGSIFPLEYASIVGTMEDIVVIVNKSDRITYVNPSAKNTIHEGFGIATDNIVGKKLEILIPENVLLNDNEIEVNDVKYDISSFGLNDWRGRKNLTCYILRNISERVVLENKLETLHLYATKISHSETYEEIGEITGNALSKGLGFDNGALCLYENGEIAYAKLWGIKESQFESVMSDRHILGNIKRLTESVLYNSVDEFLSEVGFGSPSKFKDKPMAFIPIVMDGEAYGSLALIQGNGVGFSEKDQSLLEIFGGHIASSIHSQRQKRVLQEVQLEEIKQILEGAGRVSSMVRHDLRGPLQTVRNATYIVESNPENIEKMAPIINRSVDYIVKVLEDLQYQDQPSLYEKVKLNLNTLIEQTLNQLIVPENIVIEQKLCDDPVEHMLDKIKIQRMLDNLFRNAFDAMPDGGTLSISTRKCLHGTEITVKDTGVGVEDLSKLFRPFHTTKLNGMGLGLVSVKQTVEKHGGEILVDSEPGVGTCFTIRIPEDHHPVGMSETRLNSIMTT